MSRLIVAIAAIGLLFGAMHAPRTEAASVTCASSPSVSGKLTQNGGTIVGLVLYMQRGHYVTGVCATVDGHTYSTTSTNSVQAVDPAGCFVFFKAPTYALVAAGPSWSPSCPSVTLTVRQTGQVASQH